MPIFDDQLPLEEVDFVHFLKPSQWQERTEEALRALQKNLRLRAIQLGRPDVAATATIPAQVERDIAAVGKALAAAAAPSLSPAQRAVAEAIVRLTERPALLVSSDSFPKPPQRWAALDSPFRREIERYLPKAGRIAVREDGEYHMIGTGFVVSDDLVMTAMHVVEGFAVPAPDYSYWKIAKGVEPAIDFKAEHQVAQRRAFRITDVVLGHNRESLQRMQSLDLALLRVERVSFDSPGFDLPEPVSLAASAPDSVSADFYLAGYPATDVSHATPPEVLREIFGDIYKVKRLQPGQTRAQFDDFYTFSHDCSTLAGNSGSGIVELASDRIVGLHFRGEYNTANYALQLWRLQDVLRSKGLNFVD